MAIFKNTIIDDTGYLQLPSGTTAQRPGSPSAGYMRWNTSENHVEIYDGSSWIELAYTAGLQGTYSNPGTSAQSIYNSGQTASGLYYVTNPNINNGTPFQVYCDMTTDGGGWMLIVQNASIGGATKMNYTNYSLLNQTAPPDASSRATVDRSYSILAWADYFKSTNQTFEYMLEAVDRGQWGGIWTANNPAYTFNQTSNSATNITLTTKFSSWNYDNDSIEARMPWVDTAATTNGKLTTSVASNSSWWGTIIEASSSFTPAPWISTNRSGVSGTDNPGVIWYWMRSLL